MRVPVYVQKRHIHLSQIDADKLFGKWYVFLVWKKFTQPWEFIAQEKVSIKWISDNILTDIEIILPFRKFTQVELCESDNKILWINAKITPSWELKESEAISIIWPKWNIYLNHAAIIAQKHIHMSVAQAKDFGFKNNQKVKIQTHWKNTQIIEKIRIRTNDKYDFDLHINEDIWKKFWLQTNDRAEIIKQL